MAYRLNKSIGTRKSSTSENDSNGSDIGLNENYFKLAKT
jgi:hypothetical protein